MLAALEREVVADFNARTLMAQASFAFHFDKAGIKNTMRGICNALDRLRDLVLYQNLSMVGAGAGTLGSVDAIVELHHALTEAGILEKPKPDGSTT